MADPFCLSDAQWARLEPLLPQDVRGVPRVVARRVISGIIHVLRSGCRWSDAPPSYGPRKTLCNRLVRWTGHSIWRRAFEALAALGGPPVEVLMDSTHVKAHRCSAGKGGADPGHRALPRRPHDQAPRPERRARQAAPLPADGRPSRRLPGGRGAAQGTAPAHSGHGRSCL